VARENVREEKQASKAERTSPKWAHHYAEPNSTSKTWWLSCLLDAADYNAFAL